MKLVLKKVGSGIIQTITTDENTAKVLWNKYSNYSSEQLRKEFNLPNISELYVDMEY